MRKLVLLGALAAALALLVVGGAQATTSCTFTTKGTTMKLNADCTTDATILVPNGFTLDGNKKTITAVDPSIGHFTGAVVANGGATANVKNLTVTASGLADVCDGGADRLRGIMFEGASGSITHSNVVGLTQVGSGCQEGNSIEVRNAPFDGTHPGTKTVTVEHNTISSFMKTGIVANGDVSVSIAHNDIGPSANQGALAANGIQLGFGAIGSIDHNDVAGNQWCGPSDFAATAILLFDSGPAQVNHNNVGGNADIGIYVGSDGATVEHNKVNDDPAILDCNQSGYDIGIGNYGSVNGGADNSVEHNTVSGFDTPFDGPIGDHNKVKPAG